MNNQQWPRAAPLQTPAPREAITLRDMLGFLRRNALWLTLCTGLSIALGLAYIVNTPPSYVAVARLVMDPGQQRIASRDNTTGTIIIEAAEIASQLEIVKSEAIARSVIAELNLLENPELQSAKSWRSWVTGQITSALVALNLRAPDEATGSDADLLLRQTMARFLGRISVRRVGQSYVLEIGYASGDPDFAALAANTIAQTYISNGREQQARVANSGATWLEGRLFETGRLAQEAQMEEEQFRLETGITALGGGASLEEQQLVETARQLLEAKTATATAQARLDTLLLLIEQDVSDIAIDDANSDGQTERLRDDIRTTIARVSALRQRYGANHQTVIAAQRGLEQLTDEMAQVLVRVVSAYRSNLAVAKGTERLIETELERLKLLKTHSDLAGARLAELQSRTATYRRMYANMMERLIGALEKQTFPLGNARVVTAATRPLAKNSPKTSLILPLAAILGLSAGLLIVGLRETLNRRLVPGARLLRETGLTTLGILPHVTARQSKAMGGAGQGAQPPLLGAAVNAPGSPFTEALRDVKLRLAQAGGRQMQGVIGVTALDWGDGASTVAVNLAQIYLHEGVDTLLIDAGPEGFNLAGIDAENAAGLGLFTAPPAPSRAGRKLASTARKTGGNLEVQPLRSETGAAHHFRHLPELATRLQTLVAGGRLVVVDMPSFAQSADARTICDMVDLIVVVARNPPKTTLDELEAAIARLGVSGAKIAGLVFNAPGPRLRKAAARKRGPAADPAHARRDKEAQLVTQ
ncbi:MAG: GumC family protein [Sulfitobacter sp.]